MRIINFVLGSILFTASCINSDRENNGEPYYVTHSTEFLLLDDLVAISKLSVKNKRSILDHLDAHHKGWSFKGKDKTEIVLFKKDSKELLSWHFNEKQLVYFLFNRENFEKIIDELKEENYLFIEEKHVDNGTKISFYSKNNLLVKTSDLDSALGNKSFIIIVKPN